MMNRIEYKFVGGDAEEKSINFYDGSRFLYGAARFLYHVEHFRTTGDITAQVRSRDINFVLEPTREGSFIFEVLQKAAPALAESAIKVPLQTLFSYAWSLVLPHKGKVKASTLAVEQEKTQQAIQKTTQDAIGLAMSAVQLVESQQRQQEINRAYDTRVELQGLYAGELAKITTQQKEKLLQKIRPAAIEMGKPLYRSTNKLVISENAREIVYLDKLNVDELKGHIVETDAYTLLGKIIQYNRETGWGKFRTTHQGKISFRISSGKKKNLEYGIIDSMKTSEEVMVIFYSVRDISGALLHLIFDGFVTPAPADII